MANRPPKDEGEGWPSATQSVVSSAALSREVHEEVERRLSNAQTNRFSMKGVYASVETPFAAAAAASVHDAQAPPSLLTRGNTAAYAQPSAAMEYEGYKPLSPTLSAALRSARPMAGTGSARPPVPAAYGSTAYPAAPAHTYGQERYSMQGSASGAPPSAQLADASPVVVDQRLSDQQKLILEQQGRIVNLIEQLQAKEQERSFGLDLYSFPLAY